MIKITRYSRLLQSCGPDKVVLKQKVIVLKKNSFIPWHLIPNVNTKVITKLV